LDSIITVSRDSSSSSVGNSKEKKKSGPSSRQIGYGALVLAEAVASNSNHNDSGGSGSQAEACLDEVFSRWKAEFSTMQKIENNGKSGAATVSTAALPLLAAFLAAVKELPKKETFTPFSTTTSSTCLKSWLSDVLYNICDALIRAVDDTHAVWLRSMTQRASLEDISSYIETECAARDISKNEAFNNDDVLPRDFVQQRNAACEALVCIAGAPPLLHGEISQNFTRQHLDAADKYAACAARFVKTCSTGYSALFEDFASDSVDKRVRLEAAIAILRPLVACSQSMAWPSGGSSSIDGGGDSNGYDVSGAIESKDVIFLVSSILDALETARNFVPTSIPRKSEKTRMSKKRKKNSWKLEPLTLHSWHNALSWRALEAFVANNAEKGQIFPLQLQGRIFASAVLGINSAPEGSNAVIPYIRCLRTMIPSLVQNSKVMVPAVVAAARAAVAAGVESGGVEKSAASEKQQYHELVSRLLAAGNSATLNDVVAWMGDALLYGLSIHIRKRTGMTAAVLSCCLHPRFFHPGQEALHQQGEEGGKKGLGAAVGAVRNIVKGFFDASTKHSRTFVLFSTQFSALLAAFPAVGPAYCDVVVELLQKGFDEENHLQSLVSISLLRFFLLAQKSSFPPLGFSLTLRFAYLSPLNDSILILLPFHHSHSLFIIPLHWFFFLLLQDDAILDEPTAAELTSLLEPVDPALARAHMASYAAPRVGSLCLLHSWVHEGLIAEENKDKSDDARVGLAAAREIWARLLSLAMTDPEISTGRYLHKGPTHRKKLRVWQALTVLCPAVPSAAAAETLMQLLEALDIPNAASVKQYQEIIALKMIKNQPDLLESLLLPRISDYSQQRNEAIPSLMSITAVSAFSAAKEEENDTILEETRKKELITRVVSTVLPWAATFVHGSRTFALLVLWRMGEEFPWLHQEDVFFAAFYNFFSTNADLKRLRGAMGVDFGLNNFDFERATTPKGILCEVRK
jgi:hypothetical protein